MAAVSKENCIIVLQWALKLVKMYFLKRIFQKYSKFGTKYSKLLTINIKFGLTDPKSVGFDILHAYNS